MVISMMLKMFLFFKFVGCFFVMKVGNSLQLFINVKCGNFVMVVIKILIGIYISWLIFILDIQSFFEIYNLLGEI